jgi:hypothetical protein
MVTPIPPSTVSDILPVPSEDICYSTVTSRVTQTVTQTVYETSSSGSVTH